ncbi:cardiolipin synthase [Haloferula chungangensis]|uniref:Cardiolipin synthase n=1 Tax=Haloferula chungangensis TaxID=1048331 RepID=A0ABW2L3U8_9BACT
MINPEWLPYFAGGGLILLHLIGILHILHALMHVRTSQGTIAWIVSLIAAPWIAIPLYWIAGRKRFSGYVRARRSQDADLRKLSEDMHRRLRHYGVKPNDPFGRAAELLIGLPFTRGNELELLIDGQETFDAIFESISSAQDYILVNFFIVKSDRVGNRFKDALIKKAQEGVRIYFLFDEVGSHKLPRKYLRELKDAGVECHSFGANRFWWSRLQLNFRNHRKIVVADGREAFIGGLNVGDEYLGRDKRFGAWRDTHLRIQGPAVQAIQLAYLEDWNWAADGFLDLHWNGHAQTADQTVAILPTGPADLADSWQLVCAEAANTSTKRLWIASPYFVPDGGVLTALQTAALRGVDVRILIPEKADHLLVWLSAFTFFEETLPYGIKLMRYKRGFLHQKVMLVDDRYGFVGTANLDNRSFRLNFEITALSTDAAFIDEITHMLEIDFEHSKEVKIEDLTERPFWFRLGCRAARIMAPVQ